MGRGGREKGGEREGEGTETRVNPVAETEGRNWTVKGQGPDRIRGTGDPPSSVSEKTSPPTTTEPPKGRSGQ